MRRLPTLAAALFAALFLAASAGADPPPPGIYTSPGESSAAGTPTGLAARGYALYGANCATCHGSLGQGIVSPEQNRGIGATTGQGPSLRGVGARAADFYLRTGYMPLHSPDAQPSRSRVLFTEPELRALIAYVASLGGGPKVPTPHPERGNISKGQSLFTEHCAGCHQVVAEGGYVTGARVPPLEDASATQIAEAVRIGPYLMPVFSEQQISNADLDSIISYVDYAKHPDDPGGWNLGHVGPVPEGLVAWFLAAAVLVGVCITIGKRLHA
ncbi:MAG TPA: cytochrome c [Gaiellaceae bacterium]|jgi:ubiquinol-cytochrome c reductase cytochrome c subunit|nr:cytochrome c [Gaiellaceae bacterium]